MQFVISRTPVRVSFFGGGSDFPTWYRAEGGAVLSTSIDKYTFITCRYLPPFFGVKHRIVWSHIEMVQSIREILHPAVRGALTHLGFGNVEGLEIHHQGDLPARSGVGSSSSFMVGLLHALSALRGETVTKHDLALQAIDLEQNVLQEAVGSQDQVAAAYGGLNQIRFQTDGTIAVDPVNLATDRLQTLQGRLALFYTGTSRLSAQITEQMLESLEAKNRTIRAMRDMVGPAIDILRSGDLDDFGRLLHESWQMKRSLTSAISNSTIDQIYERGMAAGALGGKLLGAGGSGFMLFYIPEGRLPAVQAALDNLLYVPFGFEHDGSTIVYGQTS